MCAVVVRALLLVLPSPADFEGTTHAGDPVVGEALRVLAQPVNAVSVVSRPQVRKLFYRATGGDPPAGLNAFRIRGDPTIYVNVESAVYREAALRPTAFHLLRLAATLLHEQVHETDDEYAAYRLQADFVRTRLAALPSSQRAAASAYWRILEIRAISLAKAQRLAR